MVCVYFSPASCSLGVTKKDLEITDIEEGPIEFPAIGLIFPNAEKITSLDFRQLDELALYLS